MKHRKKKKVYIVVHIGRTGAANAVARFTRKGGAPEHRTIDARNRTRTAASRSAIEADQQ